MSPELQQFKSLMKNRGYLVTRQRVELFELLQERTELSIKELLILLPRLDHATVYRNVKVFEELGIINRLRLGWHSKLELSDTFHHHHHHLTCLNCGKVLIIKDNSKLESEIDAMTMRAGFIATDHQLEIRGYCSICSSSGSQSEL